MNAFVAFVKLGRPHFLIGGFILYALGAAIAAATGHAIDWQRYALGQGAITAFQWMTHYANDYFDYEADLANRTPTKFSGGSRMLVSGQLPAHVALIASLVLAAIGVALTIAITASGGGGLALPTLALVLVLAWAYSAPPLRLCARGLGELDTAIVVTTLVPWFGFYLQAPSLRGGEQLALTIVPLALLQFAMLLAIEFPDAAGDETAAKRTLVVRLGANRAARLYAVITAAAYVWPLIAYPLGMSPHVVLGLMAPAPIALWRIVRLSDHANADAFERMTFFAVFLVIATSLSALIAWLT